MKVRIVRGFGPYKPGQVFDWARGMSRVMIARGLVEEVVEPESDSIPEPAEIEEAVASQPRLEKAVERQARKPKR